MAQLIFLLCNLVFAQTLEFVAESSLEPKLKFENTRVAGLSQLQFKSGFLWALSDDRGQYGDPRLYKMEVKEDYSVKPLEVLKIVEPKGVKVLDLEAFHLFQNGKFLFSSEGDLNQKPRVMPLVRFWDPHSKWGDEIQLPEEIFPEPMGLQTKGLQNNFGFESMAVSEDEKNIWLWSEASLYQNNKSEIEVLEFQDLKLVNRRTYLRDKPPADAIEVFRGVSDVLWFKSDCFFVLERWARIEKPKLLKLGAELFIVSKAKEGWEKKKLLTLDGEKGGNWEGMTSRTLPDGRKQLVLVSDNNLESKTSTRFLFYTFKE